MILQWLYHFVISSRVCPAQCPDASTLSFLFFFFSFVPLCYSSTQYPQKTCSPLSTLTFSHQSPCTLLVTPHVGHIAQIASNLWSATWKALPWRSGCQGCHVLTFCSNPNRWPCSRGVVPMERVFNHLWGGLADQDEVLCVVFLQHPVQWSSPGAETVQQLCRVPRWAEHSMYMWAGGEGRCTENWLPVISPLWYLLGRRCFLFPVPCLCTLKPHTETFARPSTIRWALVSRAMNN